MKRPYVPRRPPSAIRFIATFGFAWLVIGLFTGTFVLVVAVRGILDLVGRLGLSQKGEDRVLIGVILLFIALTFMLARRVVRTLYRQSPTTRRLTLAVLTIPAALSAYAWTNPARFLARFAGSESTTFAMKGGPSFIFGAYPDEARLKQLKAQGVTNVVSLQSPDVVVEISGITEERAATAREGMTFIEAPMLPWVSDNTESLEKIRQIALHGKGSYYIHCGLGRDRVNIAKRVIEAVRPDGDTRLATVDVKSAIGFERRTERFEHGMPMKVRDGAWVVPYLNDAEFYGFILQGQPGHVYMVSDAKDTAQQRWVSGAEKQMKQYAVAFTEVPAGAPAALVTQLRAQPGPFTVLVPTMTNGLGDPQDPTARAIASAYGVRVMPLKATAPLTPGETPNLVAAPPVKKAGA